MQKIWGKSGIKYRKCVKCKLLFNCTRTINHSKNKHDHVILSEYGWLPCKISSQTGNIKLPSYPDKDGKKFNKHFKIKSAKTCTKLGIELEKSYFNVYKNIKLFCFSSW